MSAVRPSVLLVDDNRWFRHVARELLTARGYEIVGVAESSATARAVLESRVPDLALIDVRLGAECGFALSRELTRAHPAMAVLLMSTNADLGDWACVQASGASGFLPKWQLAAEDLVL